MSYDDKSTDKIDKASDTSLPKTDTSMNIFNIKQLSFAHIKCNF